VIAAHRKQRIWLARHRVDFRRQHDGLLAEAFRMNLDPFAGDCVIFVGKNRRSVKVLYADETGLWLSAKKFTMEAMKTKLEFLLEPVCQSITQAELAMLLEGSAYSLGKKVQQYTRSVDIDVSYQENPAHHAERSSAPFHARAE